MLTGNAISRALRKWVLPDLAILLFCLLLLVIVWAAAAWQIERDRQTNIDTIMHDGDKFSRTFEEHVRQVLKTNDQYMTLLKDEYEQAGAVTPRTSHLLAQVARDPLVVQMALVDARGQIMASFLSYAPEEGMADRPFFKFHTTANAGRLFVGEPIQIRLNQKTVIPLSRRLNNADGSFAGIVYIGIDPAYFSNFYQAMEFDESYAIRVIGLDSVIRASNTVSEIGYSLAGGVIFKEIPQKTAGFYHSPGTHFGIPRLMTYRLMSDYPLLVQVGVAEDAFAPVRERRLTYLGSAGGVSLFILFFTGRLVVRSHRQRRTEERLRLSEEKYSKAFRVSPDSVNINRFADGKYIEINEGFTRMSGYEWADVAGKTSLELGIWTDPQARARLQEGLATRKGAVNLETQFRRKDGSLLYGLMSAAVIEVAGEKCILSVVRDITERKEAELDLKKSNQELAAAHEELIATEEELRRQYDEILAMNQELAAYEAERSAILGAIPDLMLLFDKDGLQLIASLPADFESSVDVAAATGRNVVDFEPADIAAAIRQHIREALATGSTGLYQYSTLVGGSRRHREMRFSKVNDTKVLAMVRDITAIRKSEEQVEFLSLHDPLTGAYNRTYFEEEMLRLQMRGHKSLGIFVCDVDGLKLINDTLGHRHGDELLKKVAAILDDGLTPPDFIARIGGDEFAVILFEPNEQMMADREKHYRYTVARYNEENPSLPLSLSVGWAIDLAGTQIDRLFKEADNNMYRQKMHQSQSVRGAIVQTMMKALEARDHITEGHADRLGELMERMGHKLQLPQATIADLRLLAKFHDIGKVGIPDSILGKPGKLTPEELAVMRRHCEIGFRIARSSPDLAPIADWILKHQEHWDGRGYPLGLAGDAIPIECRILGIVDAFDAMTNDRPYRKALSVADAIAEIRRCAGSQFDPEIAAKFIELIDPESN